MRFAVSTLFKIPQWQGSHAFLSVALHLLQGDAVSQPSCMSRSCMSKLAWTKLMNICSLGCLQGLVQEWRPRAYYADLYINVQLGNCHASCNITG